MEESIKAKTKPEAKPETKPKVPATSNDAVTVELRSAVRHDGKLSLAGETLTMSRTDADRLVRKGVATITD